MPKIDVALFKAISDFAHAEILDLEIVFDAVPGPFAADPGFLDAPERRDLRRDQARIDPDDAVLHRLGDAPHAAEVAGVKYLTCRVYSLLCLWGRGKYHEGCT